MGLASRSIALGKYRKLVRKLGFNGLLYNVDISATAAPALSTN
jgi:hypothetical protein